MLSATSRERNLRSRAATLYRGRPRRTRTTARAGIIGTARARVACTLAMFAASTSNTISMVTGSMPATPSRPAS